MFMRHLLVSSLLFVGCNKGASTPSSAASPAAPSSGAAPSGDHAPAATEAAPPTADTHGGRAAIGRLEVSGWAFEISLVGTLTPGKEAAVEAKAITTPPGRDWKTAGAYAWVEDAAGNPVTAPSKPVIENGQLHFHAAMPPGSAPAAAIVLRMREEGRDDRARLAINTGSAPPAAAPAVPPSVAPAHTHEKTPHDGIIAAWKSNATPPATGFAEVKLHDDKGDVEVWLATDRAFTTPFRLPVAARPTLTLVDLAGRTLTLAPRDLVDNKDEGGIPHLTEGKTDYFIFPGTTGEDATALVGKAFSSLATLRFDMDGQMTVSEEFVLQPHTHAHGEAH